MTQRVSTVASEKVLLPRESLTEAEKWRYAIDNTLKLCGLGFLSGAAFSLIVFRNVGPRIAVTALGGGFGLGKSYVDMRYVFGHEVVAEAVWTAEVVKRTNHGTAAFNEGETAGPQ
ncbi:hypothetical protein TcCL_NonESM11136 [Trypanosoma cruzi]|uniref:MICOS complex subunit MIC10 n=1 Tax=Trypanosoma cruzi (strain CL Brener) TaxID=353153 RepID=Q4DBY3_TRYCC|nr:hypothetical protein, conserved [Trypanosoma cruzi]EAN90032.1 hypothetical protein, conserved [Trypanosoma cruzi]RNC39504.1 hypothetical protein TcCL_NonESM11136 [Trypanosoma cruzi]|eukprot:XP_811883.1 hypothetical protein [Trypanosoma cruzi strain CL Brener]